VDIRHLSVRTFSIAFVVYASAALALSGNDSLSDWREASREDRFALVEAMTERVDRHGVTVIDLYACIDEVASDATLGSQKISAVGAGCILLLET
jgi:hypothetical protein